MTTLAGAVVAVLFEDPEAERESILATVVNGTAMPMVFTWEDGRKLEWCRTVARAHARATGHKVRIVRFVSREQLEEFG